MADDNQAMEWTRAMIRPSPDAEWIGFPGGQLEGRPPKALCPTCREALRVESRSRRAAGRRRSAGIAGRRTLCFQCYRAEIDRERRLRAAGQLDTASEERFQTALPFEPVNRPRLERLRAERLEARAAARQGTGQCADKRRRAQIAARHALQAIVEGLRARRLPGPEQDRRLAAAAHLAELQLPDAWLPFVLSGARSLEVEASVRRST